MATAAQTQPTPTTTDPVLRWLERRGATNRANSQHSTGPRTEPGKQRSSLNALRHGLTARTAVLPTEDPEAYQRHIQQFLDEYQPATATETQLVHELANTAWRINRIPFLEAEPLSQNPTPQTLIPQLATLGLHGSGLSRQFQKALEQLRDIQEAQRARRAPPTGQKLLGAALRFARVPQKERRRLERRQLNDAAEVFMRHQCKGLPWQPEEDGFVFSKAQRVRRAPPSGLGTGSRRAPFCASSSKAQRARRAPPSGLGTGSRRAPFCVSSSKAQRVRRAPLNEAGTVSRRAPFCASSSKEQVERHAQHLMRILPVHYAPFISQWDPQQPTEATI